MYECTKKFLPLLFLLLVFVDQLSKYIVRSSGGFYICNPNIAFGIKVSEISFWLLWIAFISVLLFLLYKKSWSFNYYFLILILSGAISNMLDRFIHGCIIDFIDLRFWPIFNLADIFIVIGVILILIKILNPKH
jgi:signal peptidase II